MKSDELRRFRASAGVAVLVAAVFTVGMVHSAERTVLGEYITADW